MVEMKAARWAGMKADDSADRLALMSAEWKVAKTAVHWVASRVACWVVR